MSSLVRTPAIAVLALAACGAPTAGDLDASVDAPALAWATYVIAPGHHDAQLVGRQPKNPIDGVASVVGRSFELALDASAIYALTMPTEPADQFDWNKLPGLSDCGAIDLSGAGRMFGWRGRLDLTPPVPEVTASANNASVHLTPEAPLFTLDAADLEAQAPLHYRLWREPTLYRFAVEGEVRGRAITATATLPRRCTDEVLDPLAWAGAFYFGGTSTAPHEVTARIRERPFSP